MAVCAAALVVVACATLEPPTTAVAATPQLGPPTTPARLVSRADVAPISRPAGDRCLVPGSTRTLDRLWRPDMRAAIGYAHSRRGDIAFAVRTEDRFYGYRPDHVEWSASVIKAMLMVAYLDMPSVADRALDPTDRGLLGPMIRVSDNDDAQRVFDTVGQWRLQALAQRVGMTHFATDPVWGATRITARDQTKFFLHIGRCTGLDRRADDVRRLPPLRQADVRGNFRPVVERLPAA